MCALGFQLLVGKLEWVAALDGHPQRAGVDPAHPQDLVDDRRQPIALTRDQA